MTSTRREQRPAMGRSTVASQYIDPYIAYYDLFDDAIRLGLTRDPYIACYDLFDDNVRLPRM